MSNDGGWAGRCYRRWSSARPSWGFRTLTLDTTVQQAPAIQLYTQSGYREVDRSRKGSFKVLEFEKELE